VTVSKRMPVGFKLVGAGIDHGRIVIDPEAVTAIEERQSGSTIYLRGAKGVQVTASFDVTYAALFGEKPDSIDYHDH